MKEALKGLTEWPLRGFNRVFLCTYYALMRKRYQLEPVENLQRMRLLVLAPHVDDEVIGCGGYLSFLARQDNVIRCIYTTDGAASIHPMMSRREIARAREKEGREVASFYGFEPPVFLGEEDGKLSVEPPTVQKIRPFIESFAPDAVFLPCFLDGHRDHVATAGIGLQAMSRAGFPGDFPLYLYAVNSPLTYYTANRFFALREEWEIKKQALELFQSQTLPFEVFLTLDSCRKNALSRSQRRGAKGAEFYSFSTLSEYYRVFALYGPEMYRNYQQISSPHNLVRHFFSGWPLKKEAGEHFRE